MDKIKAVIYARYSSHAQREESIEGQLRECHDYALKNGFIVLDEYCDRAISGRTDNRPAFQKMIKDSESGAFQAVIMYTLDRFARNRYDSAIYKAKLKKNGVKVYYAKQPLPDTPEGIILESVLEGYAEYYSQNLSRGVKRGMKDSALKCIAQMRAPFGYKIVDKHYQIDPVEAEGVKLVFDLYLQGKKQTEIVEILNSRGYKTKTGREFQHSAIYKMLTNRMYYGLYHFGEVDIEGGVPAIVSKDTFDRVAIQVQKNKRHKGHYKTDVNFLLTTKLFCGHCGRSMVGESGQSHTGRIYYYYKCLDKKKGGECKKRPVPKDWLEKEVIDYTVQEILTDDVIKDIATQAAAGMRREAENDSVLQDLKAKLKDVDKKLENLSRAIEDGVYTPTTKQRLLDLEAEKEDLQIQIDREGIKKPVLTAEQIAYWLQTLRTVRTPDEAFYEKIIDTFINKITVTDINDDDLSIEIGYILSEMQ